MATQAGFFLATRRGSLTLLLLCAVQPRTMTAATTRRPEPAAAPTKGAT